MEPSIIVGIFAVSITCMSVVLAIVIFDYQIVPSKRGLLLNVATKDDVTKLDNR